MVGLAISAAIILIAMVATGIAFRHRWYYGLCCGFIVATMTCGIVLLSVSTAIISTMGQSRITVSGRMPLLPMGAAGDVYFAGYGHAGIEHSRAYYVIRREIHGRDATENIYDYEVHLYESQSTDAYAICAREVYVYPSWVWVVVPHFFSNSIFTTKSITYDIHIPLGTLKSGVDIKPARSFFGL